LGNSTQLISIEGESEIAGALTLQPKAQSATFSAAQAKGKVSPPTAPPLSIGIALIVGKGNFLTEIKGAQSPGTALAKTEEGQALVQGP
jgi:hypothetical protein